MDWLSTEFLTALAAVVAIDLVLAGDNAIVIALAARNVPKKLQKSVMIWGAGAAVVMRSVMTMVVVWLLSIPGLLFAGGVMLIWIAYKLLLPVNGKGNNGLKAESIKGSSSFWGALRTIVVADVVMGVDNVLGVAGAAHGNFALVIIGLAISIPILIWGSTLLLGYVERFPVIMYIGASVLAFTAAKMITAEPYLKDLLAENTFMILLLYVVIVGGVLWVGFVKNHRRMELEISARVSDFASRCAKRSSDSRLSRGDCAMKKILVPVDGSHNSNLVIPHVIHEYQNNPCLEIHLLNVQPRFSAYIARFIKHHELDDYRRAQAQKSLYPVSKALDGFKVPYTLHVAVGNKGELIARMAQELGCDHIVMSTARKNSLTRMLEDSVTNKVLELSTVPVEMIAGDAVSGVERYGIPAALASALGLVFLAAAN